MTIKDLGKTLVNGCIKVGKKIIDANIMTCLKVGVVVGSAVVSIWLSLKKFKDKSKLYKAQRQPESATEEGLDINYKDLRKQKDLHRSTSKKLRKELERDLRPRKKNSNKRRNINFDSIELDEFEKRENYDSSRNYERAKGASKDILSTLKDFMRSSRDYRDYENERDNDETDWMDRMDLREIWNNGPLFN